MVHGEDEREERKYFSSIKRELPSRGEKEANGGRKERAGKGHF